MPENQNKVPVSWAYMDGAMEPFEGKDNFDPGWIPADLWRKYQVAERRWTKLRKLVREAAKADPDVS